MAAPTYSNCHGCSLCLLSCPMWLQKRDVAYSAQGMARALQNGAEPHHLAEPLQACLLCGICNVICPEKIDLQAMIERGLQRLDPAIARRRTEACPTADHYAMSQDPQVARALGPDDLYIVDARSFHGDHAGRIHHYESLRRATGCSMNLDLHRMAIPTGIEPAVAGEPPRLDHKQQIEWLIRGRSFSRIVVESRCDRTVLAEITGKPVLHVSELIGGTTSHA